MEELKAALTATLGVKVVVCKERRLIVWEGVRIHLDRVAELGSFIEFEALASPGACQLAEEEAKVSQLRAVLEIADVDLVGGSYCDLALAESHGRAASAAR